MRQGIRKDAPFYNPDAPRWWVSSRQRVLVLTFSDEVEATEWDIRPTLATLIELEPEMNGKYP